MYDNISTTLSALVADNGTFAVGYPAGRSAGSYVGAHKHKLFVNQTLFSAPVSFTLAFTTVITVTWKGDTPLPAGAAVSLQVDRAGTDDKQPEKVVTNSQIWRAPVHYFDLGSPAVGDDDGVAASQTVTGAGTAFVLNGVLASAGKVVFDTPRAVVAGWSNAAVLTITGTDCDDQAMVEVSASGTSHTGKKAFKTITRITTSATVTGATVGSADVLGLPAFLPHASFVLAEVENGVVQRQPSLVSLNVKSPSLADAGQAYVVSPIAGNIKKIFATTNTVIATADATITAKTAAGTVGTMTIAFSGTAVGAVDELGSYANTAVAAGATIELENDDAASAGVVDYTILIEPSGVVDGVIVAGVTDAATGTTGDVRGTYNPTTTLDGTVAIGLLVALADPGNRGVAQYVG